MLNRQHFLSRVQKRWLLLLCLLLLAPLIISRFQTQPPKPQFYIQAAPSNATSPATYATSVAYSPDGQTLACAFALERRREVVRDQLRSWIETQIRFYDAHSGAYRQKVQIDSGEVHHLVFSPDSNTLRAECEDGYIRWWDVNSGRVLRQVWQGELSALAFSSDGRWQIAQRSPKSSPFNNFILLRDNTTGKTVRTMSIGSDYISSAAFSYDNKQFVLINSNAYPFDDTIRCYRTADFKLLDKQQWEIGDAFWMKFIEKSQISGVNGRPFIWHGGSKIQWLEPLKGDFRCGALSTNNQLLAAGGWRVDPPWQSRFTFEYISEIDPNAHFGHAGIWQLGTGKCVWDKQTGGKNVVSIALAPDNSQVAVAVSDTMINTSSQRRGHVEVWKLPAGLDKNR